MPEYRYQAAQAAQSVQTGGHPVYGIQKADSEEQLRADLAARGLVLVSADAILVDASLQLRSFGVPRLCQLRIGERLREAFMTGLPAHDAVRAMAMEPFEHPLLAVMPWCMVFGVFLLLPAFAWSLLVPGSFTLGIVTAVTVLVVLPVCWLILYQLLDRVPRRQLSRLAALLESGEHQQPGSWFGMPKEVRAVMSADVGESQKALAISELIPVLMGSRFHRHRFVLSLLGGLFAMSVLFLGGYLVEWQVIPGFKKLFQDFGVEMPWLTSLLFAVSDMAVLGGLPGFIGSSMILAGILVFVYFGTSYGPVAEAVARVPGIGLPVRWLMQAQMARVLAAMLQQDCDRSEALQAAAAATSFPGVRREGIRLADDLRSGRNPGVRSVLLSGLPLSMLATSRDRQPTEDATASHTSSGAALTRCFYAIASMLEQASQGHGRVFGMLLQIIITLVSAVLIGLTAVALFLPLIRLLNDLS